MSLDLSVTDLFCGAGGSDYVVIGNKRERMAQYGNAVTPPVMSLLLERVIGSLT